MKKKEKLRRLTAAAAAALTLFFSLSVYAQAEDEKSPPLNEAEAAETVLPAPERVGEIESLRKKNSRTYEMSDGSYECVIYAEDVNYEDESGKLVGIDNSLIADTEYAYKNKANSWNAYFPEFLTDEKGLCVKRGDYSLSFSIFSDSAIETVKEADVFKAKLSEDISEAKITEDTYYEELSKDNRSLVYENEAVDFAYTVKTGYLKEDIILKRRIPGFEVNFLLKLKGIAAEQEESAVIFRNEAGEEVFKMLPMYMEDAAGNYSEDVHYSLKEHEDGYILTVTPDEAFLENAEYPVKIDPTVTVTGAGSTSDTCVDEQYPASNYYSRENLWTGGALGTNAMRTYIRFSMPAGVNSTDINSATLRIKKREHSDPTAAIYPVDYDWDSRVITWNNKPSYNGNINLGTLTKDSGAWFKADLTTCTKNFISGAWTNYGIVLKEPSETNSAYKTKYYSSDAASPNKPELVINYKSSGGSSGGDTGGGTTTNYVSIRKITDKTYREEYPAYMSKINTYISDIAKPFKSCWDIQFTEYSWFSNTTLPASKCPLPNNTNCHTNTSLCGVYCQDNTSTPNHHKNHFRNWGLLYDEGKGSADITIGFFGFKPCSAGGLSLNWLSTVCQPNLTDWSLNYNRRTLQHEISHLFGCKDDNCTPGQPCIMSGGYDSYTNMNQGDIWCDNCKKTFNRLAH